MRSLWVLLPAVKQQPVQRPVHQEAEALAGASPATGTEKFREFRWYRGQDLTLGTAGWEKPSFLTHREVIM